MKGIKTGTGGGFKGGFALIWRGLGARAQNFHAQLVLIVAALTGVVNAQEPQFNLTLLKETAPPESFWIQSAAPVGNRLFSAAAEGVLLIHDISQPDKPVEISRLAIGIYPNKVVVSGHLVFVCTDQNGLQIVDMSDIANPRLIGDTMDLGSKVDDVVIKGDVAFAVSRYGGVRLYDVSNPADPKYLSVLDNSETVGIALQGDILVASYLGFRREVTLYNVSNPRAPLYIASVGNGYYGAFAVTASHLYVLDGLIAIYDITNPAAPVFKDYFRPQVYPRRFVAAGDYGYSFGNGYMEFFDLRGPSNIIGHYIIVEQFYTDVRAEAGRIFATTSGTGVEVYGLEEPLQPNRIGQLNLQARAGDIKIVGSLAFVANGGAGLQILDISDPANAQVIGVARTRGAAFASQVRDGIAFVATGFGGLEIFDVSNPHAPVAKGRVRTEGKAMDVAVIGSTAFVADEHRSIVPIDVTDPNNPQAKAYLGFSTGAPAVGALGTTLFAGGSDWVVAFNASDPTNPRYLGNFRVGGQIRWLSAHGARVVAGDYSRVAVVNVDNPAKPIIVRLGYMTAEDGTLANDYLYLATESGLQIFDTTSPRTFQSVGSAGTPRHATTVAVVGDKVFLGQVDGAFSIYQAVAPPRVRVQEPATGVRHRIRDTVRVEWTTQLITSPTWVFELQGKPMVAIAVSDGGNAWHADFIIPETATNSVRTTISVRDAVTGARGYYEPFVLEGDVQLQITRVTNHVQIQWSSFFTNYSLFRATALAAPASWQKIPPTSLAVGTNAITFLEKAEGAAFFQLRRDPP